MNFFIKRSTIPALVTPADVHIYQTLEGAWRAYLRVLPSFQVWGLDRASADALLREQLSAEEIPFDWGS